MMAFLRLVVLRLHHPRRLIHVVVPTVVVVVVMVMPVVMEMRNM